MGGRFTGGTVLVDLTDGRSVWVHHWEMIPDTIEPAMLAGLTRGGFVRNDEDTPLAGKDAAQDGDHDVVALAERLEESRPNADDTIALAHGDLDEARRVLDAERLTRDRKGVVKALEAIISGAS